MLRVRRGERRLVIYGLVASFKAEKRKINVGDAWFRVSSLSLSLSISLSVSQSQLEFWSADYRLPSFDLSRNLSFMLFFSSNRIRLDFICFFTAEVMDWPKNCFYHSYFWQISSTFCYALILCAETPSFHFEESLSTDKIWWMLSWALVAIIILCERWIRKRSVSVI